MLTDRFDRALVYASSVHGGEVRKGTTVPYISHLLMVAGLVLEHGGTEDEAIGALLHDAVEDHGGRERLRDIEARFGAGVAEIVEGCSDAFVKPKPPWLERKQKYVAGLPRKTASVRLVSAADKLANVRSIIQDYRTVGEALWSRFNAPREDQLRYYRALAQAFTAHGPASLARELDQAVTELEQLVERQAMG